MQFSPCDDGADCPAILRDDRKELVVGCRDLRVGAGARETRQRRQLWRSDDGTRQDVILLDIGIALPQGAVVIGFFGATGSVSTNGAGYDFLERSGRSTSFHIWPAQPLRRTPSRDVVAVAASGQTPRDSSTLST